MAFHVGLIRDKREMEIEKEEGRVMMIWWMTYEDAFRRGNLWRSPIKKKEKGRIYKRLGIRWNGEVMATITCTRVGDIYSVPQ